MWIIYNSFTQLEKAVPIRYFRNPIMNSIFCFTLCFTQCYYPLFPGKIILLSIIWFLVLDSYYFIIIGIEQNSLISELKNPFVNVFSTYFIVLTEILINQIPRMSYKGDEKSVIYWVNSEFWAIVYLIREGDNFVDQSDD